MEHITAVGFDLFDTLITLQSLGFHEAMNRLVHGLQAQGIAVEDEPFLPIYRETAQAFMGEARRQGRETHNRFWISAALQRVGYEVAPEDARITHGVEAYFSAFLDHATLLPDTLDMLGTLRGRYRLGLLSNFTHPPVVHKILARLGLDAFFDVQLVSGTLGYRKPHRHVFEELTRQFGVSKEQIAFVGDDLDADLHGAQQAGMQPIRTTYARAYKATLSTDVPARPGDNPDPPVWVRMAARTSPPASETEREPLEPTVPIINSWDDLLVLLNVA